MGNLRTLTCASSLAAVAAIAGVVMSRSEPLPPWHSRIAPHLPSDQQARLMMYRMGLVDFATLMRGAPR